VRTCEAPDCLRPTRNGRYCEAHAKRLQRGASLTAPVKEARSLRQVFLDAVLRYASADSDEEYELAEAALYMAGKKYFATVVRGGRPPKASPEVVAEVYASWGSVAATARQLAISRQAVARALGKRGARKFRTPNRVRV
jgi:hypothetical protein